VFSTITHLKMGKAHTSSCCTDFCKIRWSTKDRCCHFSFRMCTQLCSTMECVPAFGANRYYVYRCINIRYPVFISLHFI